MIFRKKMLPAERLAFEKTRRDGLQKPKTKPTKSDRDIATKTKPNPDSDCDTDSDSDSDVAAVASSDESARIRDCYFRLNTTVTVACAATGSSVQKRRAVLPLLYGIDGGRLEDRVMARFHP